MTVVLPVHRALSTKLAGRSFHLVTRFGYNPWLTRVNHNASSQNDIKPTSSSSQSSRILSLSTRSYATAAAAKPAGRPKAHTGRTPAKRTARASTSKKPGPKTAAGKKKVGRKPKAKKTTTKAKAKPKRKAVKAPSKTALNRQRIELAQDLKKKALLDTPKKLPDSPWLLIFSEAHKGNHDFSESREITKQAAQKLKNLSPEDKEKYNHEAHANKEKNEQALKKWLSQYTPNQIREANNARKQLKREYKAKNPNKKTVQKFPLLQDDRLVKRATTPYICFSKDRYASGDFEKMTVGESAKLIGREWKALSAAEKKQYEDQAKADQNRYEEEHKTVYGTTPPTRRAAKAS